MSRNSYDSANDTLTPIGGWQSVDNALSSTSHNPVYNSVVTGAVNGIEQSVAPQENGDTLSQGYAIGAECYRNNTLYRFKTAVTSGTSWANLTLDTDYEAATKITSQIQTLANSLSTEITNRETADGVIWNSINSNGSVNLAGPQNAKLVTHRESGVLFTINPNGTITTSNEQAESNITYVLSDGVHLTAGTYKLVGGKNANCMIFFGYTENNTWHDVAETNSQDAVTFTVTSERSDFRLGIFIKASETPNFEFRPMITRADYPYCDYAHYVPYAMTNRDLSVIDEDFFTASTSYTFSTKSSQKFGRLCIITLEVQIPQAGGAQTLGELKRNLPIGWVYGACMQPNSGNPIPKLVAINPNNSSVIVYEPVAGWLYATFIYVSRY